MTKKKLLRTWNNYKDCKMNLDKIKTLNNELEKQPKITDALNYWKNEYLDKYPGSKLWDYFEMVSGKDAFEGELRIPINESIVVPKLHSPSYGVPLEQRVEYFNWMLYYLAEKLFVKVEKPKIENEMSKPLGKPLIEGRYNRIKQIRDNAVDQLKQGKINISHPKKNGKTEEVLFLKYANNYYSTNEVQVDNKENSIVRNVCMHHFVFPYLEKCVSQNRKQNDKKDKDFKPELLQLLGIDISKLTKELINIGCIKGAYEVSLQNWFKGIKPKNPIHIDKPMKVFVSVIASLREANYIKNKKVFLYKLIHESFLFNNELISIGSITNVLKPDSTERTSSTDKENYIDIQRFKMEKE